MSEGHAPRASSQTLDSLPGAFVSSRTTVLTTTASPFHMVTNSFSDEKLGVGRLETFLSGPCVPTEKASQGRGTRAVTEEM